MDGVAVDESDSLGGRCRAAAAAETQADLQPLLLGQGYRHRMELEDTTFPAEDWMAWQHVSFVRVERTKAWNCAQAHVLQRGSIHSAGLRLVRPVAGQTSYIDQYDDRREIVR